MSSSSTISSNPSPHLLHVDTAAATTTNGSAASPGSASSPRPSTTGSSGGGSSGQNQACAACKYQRRKCNPDCPLARYFPADQQRLFLNAHRLFGVSNIQKTLRQIDPEYGPDAMRALIYQSEARAADPIYGCVHVIKKLEHEVHVGNAQLEALRHQIAIYRQAAATGGNPIADPALLVAAPGQQDNVVMTTMDALYGGATEQDPAQAGAGFVVVNDQQVYNNAALKVDDQDQPASLPLYDYFCYDGTAGDEATRHDATVHNEYCYSDASVKAGSPLATLGEQLENHCQMEAAPFVDAFDVKPQDLSVTIMDHQCHGGGVDQLEHNLVAAAVVKYDDADQKMAEPAPAAAQCHLELGFSSF